MAIHIGDLPAATWDMFRTSSGWALTLRRWPDGEELDRLLGHLRDRAGTIHFLDVSLPEHLPSEQYRQELYMAVSEAVGHSTQIGVWQEGRLIHAFNGYRRWRDPIVARRERPYIALWDERYRRTF